MRNNINVLIKDISALILFFCTLSPVFIWSQKPTDSLSTTLKIVNLEVQENNYTGLDDGSETKLRNAMKYLQEKLPEAQQGNFKGYELGLYRVADNDDATNSTINDYVEQVENAGTFYILPVKIWSKDNQTIDEFRIYFNLPNDLPALQEYTKSELQKKAVEFIQTEFNNRNKDIGRVKQAIADGLREWVDFIYQEVKLESMENGFSFSSALFNTEDWTFFTPTGALISLPGGYEGKKFVTCGYALAPIGAVSEFKRDGITYIGWYYPRSGTFSGYGPKDPANPLTSLPFINPVSVGEIHTDQVYTARPKLNPTTNKNELKAEAGEYYGENPEIFSNPTEKGVQLKFNKTPLVGNFRPVLDQVPAELADVKQCYLLEGYPDESFRRQFNDIKKPGENTLPTPNVKFTTGSTFVDYTGLYTDFKTALTKSEFTNNKVDIIISDDNSFKNNEAKLAELNTTLSNTDALTRAVLWVHIDGDGVPKRKVVLPTGPGVGNLYDQETTNKLLSSSEDNSFTANGNGKPSPSSSECNVNPDTGVPGGTTGEASLLNFFGFSQLMFTSVSEFLDGAKLDEPKYWDGNDPDYFLKDAPYVSMLRTTGFDKLISFGCGAFTGSVDAIISFKDDLASKKEVIDFIFDSKARADAFGKISETYDLLFSPENAKMRAFIFATLKSQLFSEINEITTNPYKPWYYAGYFPANLAMESAIGGGVTKLKDAIGVTSAVREAAETAKSMISKVATPQIENLLGRMIRKQGINGITQHNTTHSWQLSKDGHTIANIGDDGYINEVGSALPNGTTIIDQGAVFPVKGNPNSKSQVVKTKDAQGNEKWAVVPFDKDKIVEQILAKYGLTNEYYDAIEDFVNSHESASRLLDEDIFSATSFLKNIPSPSGGHPLFLDFLDDLKSSKTENNGIGRLLNTGLSEDLVNAWHLANKSPLRKNDRLDATFLGRAKNFRQYQKNLPRNEIRKGTPGDPDSPFYVETAAGNVKYDNNGFPLFYPDYSPSLPGMGKEDFIIEIEDLRGYLPAKSPDPNDINKNIDPADFTKARNGLIEKLQAKGITNINIDSGSSFEINDVMYTWHHHEDGRSMIPVLQSAHIDAKHSGGASVLKNDIKGLYPGPK